MKADSYYILLFSSSHTSSVVLFLHFHCIGFLFFVPSAFQYIMESILSCFPTVKLKAQTWQQHLLAFSIL